VVAAARAAGIKVRGAMSCTVGCPYEGEIAPRARGLPGRLMKGIGVQHVGVADTIGVGTPLKVQARHGGGAQALRHGRGDLGHFHDTYGQALANTLACAADGVWHTFDTSGRRPGRLPLCQGRHRQRGHRGRGLHAARHGHRHRHRPGPLVDAGAFISGFLDRKPNSRAATAILNKRAPIGHASPPVTLIDRELFRFEEIWAAAGHPHGVFKLRPQDLVALTGAPVADVDQPVLAA
jgi:hydroxymethylglutaryl-CoA lyase